MKPSASLLPVFALLAILGCLVACSGFVSRTVGPPPAEPVIQPSFTIDTGLMDAWGLKKTGPTQMAVSPDGKFLLTLAMSNNENVQVWDLATRQKRHAFRNDIGTMHAHVAIAPDSKTAAYVQLRPKGGIILFDLVTGKRIRTILDKGRRIISVSPHKSLHFSPDGKRIVLGCKDQILGWDTATGDLKFGWSEPLGAYCLTPFFDNGTKIACYDGGGNVNIRDAATGQVIKSLDAGGSRGEGSLAITPDQRTLISGIFGPFKFWALPNGEFRKEFKEEFGTYKHIVALPDNRTVAWLTNNSFILYDLETATKKQRVKIKEQPYATGLAVTPDGATLLTAADDATIKGWRVNANGQVE